MEITRPEEAAMTTALTIPMPPVAADENWADEALAAWIAAAADEGVTATPVWCDWDDYAIDYGTLVGAVTVDGELLILEIDPRTDTVAARPAAEMVADR